MMTGIVTEEGEPLLQLSVAGQTWRAIVDTGFNGDLELPETLKLPLHAQYVTEVEWLLASGQSSVEDLYEADFPFDGETVSAEVTFAATDTILVGTQLLRRHRLTIDFPARTVLLERLS